MTKVLIDIPEKEYQACVRRDANMTGSIADSYIATGTFLPNSQGDLISRSELKKTFEEVYPLATNEMGGVVNKQIYDTIDNAPTVAVNCRDCDGYEAGYSAGLKDAERPHGEWARTGLDYFNNFYKCSLCGREILLSQGDNLLEEYPFCHCGADMRKGSEEE